MNVFLIASIHGKKKYEHNYRRIIDLVEACSPRWKINAGHIFKPATEIAVRTPLDFVESHKSLIEEIKKCDAVFAELSYPSTSVGYFVAMAASFSKPIVIFFAGEEEPHLFKTLEAINERLSIVRYQTLADLDREVPSMMDFVKQVQDTRFNFFISPNLSSYLDWVSRRRRLPRSVYLRRLIDEDMSANAEYLEDVSG